MLVIESPQMTARDWRDAREFCLATIKEVYGIDYTPEWHQDLDAMGSEENVYSEQNKGWFVIVRNEDGRLVACAGLRSLATRPSLAERFEDRWSNASDVGALWRSYVAADYQAQGIGTMMKRRRLEKAKELSYTSMYLHASRSNPVAITFGKKFAFDVFAEDPDGTVHMAREI